jgi:hypothetical protein
MRLRQTRWNSWLPQIIGRTQYLRTVGAPLMVVGGFGGLLMAAVLCTLPLGGCLRPR